jgi:hypothetical protein
MRLRRLVLSVFAVVLAAASIADAAAPIGPYSPGNAGTPNSSPKCGYVSGFARRATAPSAIQVVQTRRLSCKSARSIVRSCLSNRTVKGWRPSGLNFTSYLSSKNRRVGYRMVTGPRPTCSHGVGIARTAGQFGPFQEPVAFPNKWPAPFTIVYEWRSPVNTYTATIFQNDITTINFVGYGHNRDGKMRAFWFQYGKTRDLGSETEKQNPPITTDDAPISFEARVLHLKAKTRFFYRAVGTFDQPDGSVKTVYGAEGSFVTKRYPTITDGSQPCNSAPAAATGDQLFQITESLAISCSPSYHFTNSACFPFCVNYYSGSLACNKDYPRNLNSGTWSIPIPKIGYSIKVNDLVNYWRSNDSNRFLNTQFTNKNSEGGQVGPVPGFHNWDVQQYAYPFTSTATDVRFWINCTEQWGSVLDTSALAQGEGTDIASTTPPGTPTNFKVTKAADGSVNATWDAPSSPSSSGISGYYLSVLGWPKGAPKVLADNWFTPITTETDSGSVSAAQIAIVKQATPANYEFFIVVGAVSREGSISTPATVALSQLTKRRR